MHDFEAPRGAPRGISRRTVAKAMAWSVPVVAVAATAPLVAASPPPEPPEPTFDFDNAYKNPGNSCTSACIPKQSYGVPVSVTNPSDEDYQIQFTSYTIGVKSVGVFGITAGIEGCPALVTGCDPGCDDDPDYATHSVCIPANTLTPITLYVTSNEYGSSPNTGQAIGWRWVRKSDCVVTSFDTATSATSPPNELCK